MLQVIVDRILLELSFLFKMKYMLVQNNREDKIQLKNKEIYYLFSEGLYVVKYHINKIWEQVILASDIVTNLSEEDIITALYVHLSLIDGSMTREEAYDKLVYLFNKILEIFNNWLRLFRSRNNENRLTSVSPVDDKKLLLNSMLIENMKKQLKLAY